MATNRRATWRPMDEREGVFTMAEGHRPNQFLSAIHSITLWLLLACLACIALAHALPAHAHLPAHAGAEGLFAHIDRASK